MGTERWSHLDDVRNAGAAAHVINELWRHYRSILYGTFRLRVLVRTESGLDWKVYFPASRTFH